jgi:hypothetical protein
MRRYLVLTLIIALLVFTSVAVYGQLPTTPKLSVKTDKVEYVPGDIVVITGSTPLPGVTVTITIYDPTGFPKDIRFLTAGDDCKFSISIKIPNDWVGGRYRVEARAGTASATTEFYLVTTSIPPQTPTQTPTIPITTSTPYITVTSTPPKPTPTNISELISLINETVRELKELIEEFRSDLQYIKDSEQTLMKIQAIAGILADKAYEAAKGGDLDKAIKYAEEALNLSYKVIEAYKAKAETIELYAKALNDLVDSLTNLIEALSKLILVAI